MFSFLTKKPPGVAIINGAPITMNAKETVLQAALREGIDFPNSCRVGGCATCKCRLVHGKVKELTQASYVLSDEDLDNGYILACQSVPVGDVEIEVDLQAQQQRSVRGRVVSQENVTHDITRLTVQLDESLPYKAGQYANLSLDAQPDVARSYSFATPVQPDGKAVFYVRRVPGGALSTLITETDLNGTFATIEGPAGDFWLRSGDGPLLLVAGGSGLAPILALLEQAITDGETRPATLLFGARTEQDLYALDRIAVIEKRWHGAFRFVPVLSEEPATSAWTGKRGLVTEHITRGDLATGVQGYLCGPPAMIDSAEAKLISLGVGKQDIHADRFLTRKELLVG